MDNSSQLSAKTEYVYLLRSGKSFLVKIGFTREHPGIRLKSLQTGNPEQLILVDYLAVLDGLQLETRLHETYHLSRTNGEWFDFSDERTREHFQKCWKRLKDSFTVPLFD